MSKTLSLADIKNGALINNVKKKTIEFILNGEQQKAEVFIKALPFVQTEPLYARLPNIQDDKTLIQEWIALSVADENGQTLFTADEVNQYFTLPLMSALFKEIMEMNALPKDKTDDSGKSDSPQTTS